MNHDAESSVWFYPVVLFFEIRSCYVVQAGLELTANLLPQPPEWWDPVVLFIIYTFKFPIFQRKLRYEHYLESDDSTKRFSYHTH